METRFGALLQAGDEGVQLLGGGAGASQEGVSVEGVDNRFGHASGRPLPAHCTSPTQRLLLSSAFFFSHGNRVHVLNGRCGMEPMACILIITRGSE